MCKKIGIAAVAVVAGLLILNKTKLGDWAKFGWHRAKEAISSQIPPEMEIAKLKTELADIGPKVQKHLNKMAEAKTSIDTLREDIKVHTARLEKQKATVLALREKVETPKVSTGKVGNDAEALKRAWKTYTTSEGSLNAKKDKLQVREARFEDAKLQLDAMKQMRETLESQIEQLEARLERIRVEEAEDKICFDDPMLGNVKEGIDELNKRITTMENFRDLNREYGPQSTPDSGSGSKATVSDDLLNEIDAHFKQNKGGSKVAADRE